MVQLVEGKNHYVVKRDGSLEQYDENKMRKVLMWAATTEVYIDDKPIDETAAKLAVDEILESTNIKIFNRIKIQELYDVVLQTVKNKITRLSQFFNQIARNLYLLKIHKEFWRSKIVEYPDYADVLMKGVKAGVYDKEIVKSFDELEIKELNDIIDESRDFTFKGYLEVAMFVSKYSLRDGSKPFELPQHIAMRQAIYSYWKEPKHIRLKLIKDMYDLYSNYYVIRSTPIMSQSMGYDAQMASCVLIETADTAESINACVDAAGLFSKHGGGVAWSSRRLRAFGSIVNKRGRSSGPIPFIRFFQSAVTAYDQMGVRKGAGIAYYDWWHSDIFELLELKEESGKEEQRARNLQYGMVFNKILLQRALNDQEVTLFDPKIAPELLEAQTEEEFEKWYLHYEDKKGIKKKRVKAINILDEFYKQRFETGNLYEAFDENINEQNMFNQKIMMSNLCVAGDTIITIKYNEQEEDIEIQDLQQYLDQFGEVFVYSRNLETETDEWNLITNFAQTSPEASVMSIQAGESEIICTDSHKIWTSNRGYVPAEELKFGDYIYVDGELTNRFVKYLITKPIPVYDITVDEVHNFYANKILVHNCTEITLPTKPLTKPKEKLIKNYSTNEINIEGVKEEPGEIALCNLSSIDIKKFMDSTDDEKYHMAYTLLRSMDNLIDYAYYPVKEAEYSNKLRRSIGIGVFNYAYYLASHKVKPTDPEARQLTFDAFEDFTYFMHKANITLAEQRGHAELFHETKYSEGILPYDLSKYPYKNDFKLKRDWDSIKRDYINNGGRMSVLFAIAPTASSSILTGGTEGTEFPKDLIILKQMNDIFEKQIVPEINKYGQYYMTGWDVPHENLLDLAGIRQIFLDQSQSVSLYYTYAKGKLSTADHLKDTLLAYKLGLKTIYYSYNEDEDISKKQACDSCQ